MSDHTDYKSEIDYWADMWDEMQGQNLHPEPEKPQPSEFAAKIFGDTPRDNFYDSLDMEELFQEAEERSMNPIYPDSVGADNKGPKPVWVKEDLIDELTKLKDRLFKVENETARMGQGKSPSKDPVKSGKDLMKEIESIRKEIEKVSSRLGIEDEPSPYAIKSYDKKSKK